MLMNIFYQLGNFSFNCYDYNELLRTIIILYNNRQELLEQFRAIMREESYRNLKFLLYLLCLYMFLIYIRIIILTIIFMFHLCEFALFGFKMLIFGRKYVGNKHTTEKTCVIS